MRAQHRMGRHAGYRSDVRRFSSGSLARCAGGLHALGLDLSMLQPLLDAALDRAVGTALDWLCALPDCLLEALNARVYFFVDAKKESELREDERGCKLDNLRAKKEAVLKLKSKFPDLSIYIAELRCRCGASHVVFSERGDVTDQYP